MVFSRLLRSKDTAHEPKKDPKVDNASTLPFIATPVLENAGFAAISTIFWARDLDNRLSQRFKKVLSRGLAALYSLGTAVDPLWEQRWGTEAYLQTHLWTGVPFPLQNPVVHEEIRATKHSPPPLASRVWEEAFELSITTPLAVERDAERDADRDAEPTLQSIRAPASSTPLENKRPCFAEAENLPAFDEVLPSRPLAKSEAAKPKQKTAKSTKSWKDPRGTHRRLRQHFIFQKWIRGRARKSETSGGQQSPAFTPQEPDVRVPGLVAASRFELPEGNSSLVNFPEPTGLLSEHAPEPTPAGTEELAAQCVLNHGLLNSLPSPFASFTSEHKDEDHEDLGDHEEPSRTPSASPLGKRQRLMNVFKRKEHAAKEQATEQATEVAEDTALAN